MMKNEPLKSCPFCGTDLDEVRAAREGRALGADARERELERRVDILEQATRDLEGFAYRASHDLKEPLRKIRSFGELLEYEFGSSIPEGGKGYLDSMKSASRRLGGIIDGLLEYSRCASFTLQSTPFTLDKLVRDVRLDLSQLIKDSNTFISSGFLPEIRTDRERVGEVLRQLFENAIRFRRRAKSPVIQVWTELAVQRDDLSLEPDFIGGEQTSIDPAKARWCRISVRDNGRGFEPRFREQIFEPFERLDRRNPDEGPGLGLAICRRIAERLGGAIEARGAPDRGSTFLVTLPLE